MDRLVWPKESKSERLLGRAFIKLFLTSAILLAGCSSSGDDNDSGNLKGGGTAPIISLTASPSSVDINGSSTLTWSVTNATSCDASGAWSGAKAMSDSQTVGPLTITSTFSLFCVGAGNSITGSVTVIVNGQPPPPPPTVSLVANPSSVDSGNSTTLTWLSTDATSCTASGAWSGNKATAASEAVGPLTTTSTFALICGGAGGSAGQSVTVTVNAPPPPPAPSVSMTANPTTVAYDDSTTLTWSSTNATSCVATGDWSGNKATSDSQTVGPLTTTSTFILTCSGAGGDAGQSVTVAVNPPPLPTVSLAANPTTVNSGNASTLSWSSSDATSCNAGGAWAGSKPLSGSESTGPLTQTSTFTLTCTGPGGSTNRPVTVTVQAATDTVDLSWIPPTTNEDGSPVSLSGFNIYSGPSAGSLQQIDTVNASQTTYTANNLASGTHCFGVTAVSTTSAESVLSNIGCKTIP